MKVWEFRESIDKEPTNCTADWLHIHPWKYLVFHVNQYRIIMLLIVTSNFDEL